MKTHPPSLYTVDSVIWEKKKNKGNQQIHFSLLSPVFQKPAQPDKRFDKVVPTSNAKLFDKPCWLTGVCGNAHQQKHPYHLRDRDFTFSLPSDSCKAQDIYKKGYLIISTTKSYCSSKAQPISKTSAYLSLAVKEDWETCLTVTITSAVTVFVKTCKVSFPPALTRKQNNPVNSIFCGLWKLQQPNSRDPQS